MSAAFGVLLRKELLESIRTFRLPVVAGLFLFVGLSSPVLARYLPEIIELAGGEQLGVIEIPTPTATDAVDQLVKNLAQFGALTAILLAMGLVAAEKDRGTAAFILTKPVSRKAFLGAKLAALAAVLGGCTLVAVVAGWIYTALLFEPLPVVGWVWLAVLVTLWLLAFATITFLGSVVTGSTVAAGGIGFVALLGLGIVSAIPAFSRPRARRARPRRAGRIGVRSARPNGAGKTTTLRLLVGLARPTRGTVVIDDGRIDPARPDRRLGIGVLDQDPRYYGWMRGRELVEMVARLHGRSPATRASARPRCSSASGCRTRRTGGSAGIRAGCASGWGSPRHSSTGRGSSSSTSPSARWIRRVAATSSPSSPSCARPPRSSSRPTC